MVHIINRVNQLKSNNIVAISHKIEYANAFTLIHTYTHTHTWTHTHIYPHEYAYIHAYTHTHTHVYFRNAQN